MTRRFRLALAVLVLSTGPAAAAGPSLPSGPPPAATVAPVFAGYWHEFIDHWVGALKKQNGVIMVALGIGAVSLFIITRGKWRK
ncbi:MAG: hypothetical protein JWO38_1827 [Gemmataceae bacterium]|nr:hypothetical protein [Gemmataceae bacterium]